MILCQPSREMIDIVTANLYNIVSTNLYNIVSTHHRLSPRLCNCSSWLSSQVSPVVYQVYPWVPWLCPPPWPGLSDHLEQPIRSEDSFVLNNQGNFTWNWLIRLLEDDSQFFGKSCIIQGHVGQWATLLHCSASSANSVNNQSEVSIIYDNQILEIIHLWM